ncbi:MAG TPA: hypothetical protein VNT02_08505 [Burkholderiales bacterium]|nr:hypothetical protein [Burkholderiales bacterium]
MIQDLTDHARARMRQRGIPDAVVADLLAYGRAEHDHRGCTVVYFDREARAYARRNSRAYLVLAGDGSVVTVGHRYRRISRQ